MSKANIQFKPYDKRGFNTIDVTTTDSVRGMTRKAHLKLTSLEYLSVGKNVYFEELDMSSSYDLSEAVDGFVIKLKVITLSHLGPKRIVTCGQDDVDVFIKHKVDHIELYQIFIDTDVVSTHCVPGHEFLLKVTFR